MRLPPCPRRRTAKRLPICPRGGGARGRPPAIGHRPFPAWHAPAVPSVIELAAKRDHQGRSGRGRHHLDPSRKYQDVSSSGTLVPPHPPWERCPGWVLTLTLGGLKRLEFFPTSCRFSHHPTFHPPRAPPLPPDPPSHTRVSIPPSAIPLEKGRHLLTPGDRKPFGASLPYSRYSKGRR